MNKSIFYSHKKKTISRPIADPDPDFKKYYPDPVLNTYLLDPVFKNGRIRI